LLESSDFKPRKYEGPERWVVATIALDYWNKYQEKIGSMLRSEVLDFSKKQNYREDQRKTLLAYVNKIQEMKLTGVDHVVERVNEYKQERFKLKAIEELIELQSSGQLTNDRWIEICQEAVENVNGNRLQVTDYFAEGGIESRIMRRDRERTTHRYPLLFIDPIDENIRVISRGHLGLVLGPYKKGKSLFLAHIGVHYVLQGLNVLYFTLEDPKADVEDRLDAMVSNLPIRRLHELPVKLKRRYQQYRRLVTGGLKVIDGTEGGFTISKVAQIYETFRNQNFVADCVIIDYDAWISPAHKRKERREEFSDIYVDFGRFLRKYQIIGWTGAQTQRKTENKKIIIGDFAAEDISKLRNSTCTIGIGQGDWGDDSLYLYIAAHKHDRQHIGWNIMSDRNRMIFYDRDKTMEQIKAEVESKKEDEGD